VRCHIERQCLAPIRVKKAETLALVEAERTGSVLTNRLQTARRGDVGALCPGRRLKSSWMAIDAHLRRYPASPIVLAVFATVDADAIRARVHKLDPRVDEVFFFAVSVGALFGVLRTDGSRAAMKIHKLFSDEAYLDEMQRIQGALSDAGFPAPRPLGRRGSVVWEEWIDEGTFRDAHEPEVRSAIARELARFHKIATSTQAIIAWQP
jgi:hypothetical protein